MLNNLNSQTGQSNTLNTKKIACLEKEVDCIKTCITECIDTSIEELNSKYTGLCSNVSTECLTATAANIPSLTSNAITTVELAVDRITTDIDLQNVCAETISANCVKASVGDFTELTSVVAPNGEIDCLNTENITNSENITTDTLEARTISITNEIIAPDNCLVINGTIKTTNVEATNATIPTITADTCVNTPLVVSNCGCIDSITGSDANYTNITATKIDVSTTNVETITAKGSITITTDEDFYFMPELYSGTIYLKSEDNEWDMTITATQSGQYDITYNQDQISDIKRIIREKDTGKLVILYNHNSNINYMAVGTGNFTYSLASTYSPTENDKIVETYDNEWATHHIVLGDGDVLTGEYVAGILKADYIDIDGISPDSIKTCCLYVSECSILCQNNCLGDLCVYPIDICDSTGTCICSSSGFASVYCLNIDQADISWNCKYYSMWLDSETPSSTDLDWVCV